MNTRTASGIAVYLQAPEDPAAPSVVLVHGGADRASSFRGVLRHLDGLRVTTYDRRGYGGSRDAELAESLGEHRDDLLEVLDDRPSVLVGHSFGSHVAVMAAIERPDLVPALGVYEPPVPWLDFWPPEPRASLEAIARGDDPAKVAERIVVAMSGRDAWERLSEEERAKRRREGAAFCADIASELGAPPYDWHDLRVPCLFGHGSASWPYSVDACRRLAELLGQPEYVVEGATHVGHATHPEGFAGFVRATVELSAAA